MRFVAVIAAVVFGALALCVAACDENVTGPDGNPDPQGRSGFVALNVGCDEDGRSPLRCKAFSYCSGLYPFCPGLTPGEVTSRVQWQVDSRVVRLIEPGIFEPVAPGDTVVRVYASPNIVPGLNTASSELRMSVFPDLAIFETRQIDGHVYQAGISPLSQAEIRGAVVEILDGRLAGRRATTGTPSIPPPGGFSCAGAGRYCFYAVPPGMYRLRASAAGFVTEEHEVVVPRTIVGSTDFTLRPVGSADSQPNE